MTRSFCVSVGLIVLLVIWVAIVGHVNPIQAQTIERLREQIKQHHDKTGTHKHAEKQQSVLALPRGIRRLTPVPVPNIPYPTQTQTQTQRNQTIANKQSQQSTVGPQGQNLKYYGGPIVAGPITMHILTWGPVSGVQLVSQVSSFFGAIGGSAWWNILLEYSTPTQLVSSSSLTVLPAVSLVSAFNASLVDDTLIQATLTQAINIGQITISQNKQDIFTILFPTNITITKQGLASCEAFCSYHDAIQINGTYLGYITLPGQSGGCAQGCGYSSSVFDNVCSVLSHELAETVTDVGVGFAAGFNAPPVAWFDPVFLEIGDICLGVPPYQSTVVGTDGVTYSIQPLWSNHYGACVAAGAPIIPSLSVFGLFSLVDGVTRASLSNISSCDSPSPSPSPTSPVTCRVVVTWSNGRPRATGHYDPLTKTGDMTFPDDGSYTFSYDPQHDIITWNDGGRWNKINDDAVVGEYAQATIGAAQGAGQGNNNNNKMIILTWHNARPQATGYFDALLGVGGVIFPDDTTYAFTYDYINNQITWSDQTTWKKIIPTNTPTQTPTNTPTPTKGTWNTQTQTPTTTPTPTQGTWNTQTPTPTTTPAPTQATWNTPTQTPTTTPTQASTTPAHTITLGDSVSQPTN